MTLFMSGRLIQKSGNLSELARQTVTYIDGGPEWLQWAVANQGARYELPDETTLVAAIQQGLHASAMTLLPGLGLWVSPVKLMSLGPDNLRTLAKAETGDGSEAVKEQLGRMLADHRLVTAQQLQSGAAFLQELGVEAAPLFQASDFNDRLRLQELAGLALGQHGPAPEALRREAAAWALEQARTVPEFCDYYQVYLARAGRMNALEGSADARADLARRALETLLPLAFGAMDCPQLPDRLPAPGEVERALQDWHAKGRMLGFPSLSQAVLQIVTQTDFADQSGDAARQLVERYRSRAQSFLGSRNSWTSQLGQDGATLVFDLDPGVAAPGGADYARLQVSADRVLSLREFGARVRVGELDALPASSNPPTPE